MGSVKVNFKWGKQVFSDVEVNLEEPVETLRLQLFSLSGVPPDRQKIMGVKGGVLKDDANLASLGLKPGQNLMLLGSAEELVAPTEKVVFVEDMAGEELQAHLMAGLPPGLTNAGNTCYLNSCLQCLAVVPEFKTALKGLSVRSSEFDADANLTVAGRDLFRQLETSKTPVIPYAFLLVLRSAFPQFAERGNDGGYAQQDAEECLSQILSSISRVPGGAAAVDDTFGVNLETTFTNEEDPTEQSIEIERSNKLLCHIDKDIPFLPLGIRKSMEGSVQKRSAMMGRECHFNKVSRICKLPPWLIVQEVRFDWRADTRKRSKILRDVQFPMELDLMDLTSDSLKPALIVNRPILQERKERELQEQRQKKVARYGGGAAADAPAAMDTTDAEGGAAAAAEGGAAAAAGGAGTAVVGAGTGKYELQAVLTHQGRNAEGGHYIAWVKKETDSWYKFDDDKVSMVNDAEIKKLSGGGDWHMAYILLYKHQFP